MGNGTRATASREMSGSVAISPVTVADLGAVSAIERAAFSDPWSDRSFREALAQSPIYFVAARSDDGTVLGYVVAWFVADEGQIANLAVAPAGWGKGIGRALLTAALKEGSGARYERRVPRGTRLESSRAAAVRIVWVQGGRAAARLLPAAGGRRHCASANADAGGCVKWQVRLATELVDAQ